MVDVGSGYVETDLRSGKHVSSLIGRGLGGLITVKLRE